MVSRQGTPVAREHSHRFPHRRDMGMKRLPKQSGEYLFEVVMRRHETRNQDHQVIGESHIRDLCPLTIARHFDVTRSSYGNFRYQH